MIAPLMTLLLSIPTASEPEDDVRRIPAGNETMEIRLPVAAPGDNRSCVVELPETRIASVVLAWREEDLSLEKRGGRLFLRLLRPVQGSLHVIGGSGILYRFHLRPAKEGEKSDAHVRLLSPPSRSTRRVPSIDLLRAMKTGTLPAGIRFRPEKEILLENETRSYRLLRRYDAPHHTGYLLLFENRTSEPARVEPARFDAEGLLLIGADRWEVPALSETRLYLVFQK